MGSCRALVVACILALPAFVGAQPKPPTAQQKQQASDLVKKAIARSQSGDHIVAIELYNQAYNIIPTPILLSNIGSEYQQMTGKSAEAVKYFCKYLDADPMGTNADYVTAQVKAIELQRGDQVDDKNVCKPIVKLVPPPPEPVGGIEPVGTTTTGTPVTGTAPPPKDNGPAPDEQPSPGKTLEIAGVSVVGVGVIAAVVGIYFETQARDKSNYITNYTTNPSTAGMPWPENIRTIWDEGQSDADKAIGLFIGGGLAVVGGAAMFYIGHGESASTEHVSIRPLATPNSLGIALGRGF